MRSRRLTFELSDAEGVALERRVRRLGNEAKETMMEPTLDPDDPTPRQARHLRAAHVSALLEARDFVAALKLGVTVTRRDALLARLDRALNYMPPQDADERGDTALRRAHAAEAHERADWANDLPAGAVLG